MHAPSILSSAAHFITSFLGLALLARLRRLAFGAGRIYIALLGLGLMTEGLQFFAIDRHPRWVAVGIDLAGHWWASDLQGWFPYGQVANKTVFSAHALFGAGPGYAHHRTQGVRRRAQFLL